MPPREPIPRKPGRCPKPRLGRPSPTAVRLTQPRTVARIRRTVARHTQPRIRRTCTNMYPGLRIPARPRRIGHPGHLGPHRNRKTFNSRGLPADFSRRPWILTELYCAAMAAVVN